MHTDTHMHKLECTRLHLHTFIYTNTVSRFHSLSCYLSFSLTRTRKQFHGKKVRASIARCKEESLKKYMNDSLPLGCMEDLDSSLHMLGCNVETIKTVEICAQQIHEDFFFVLCKCMHMLAHTHVITHTHTHTRTRVHTHIHTHSV